MEKHFTQTSPELEEYVTRVFHPHDPVLREIRERALRHGLPNIHIGWMDGLHLEVLARAVGAAKIVEIGTLAGFSGVCLARALPPGGRLYTFEFEPKHAEVARESFQMANVLDRVEIFVGLAEENLKKIEDKGPFDLVFIDADKTGYPGYFNWAVRHVRKGGVILADNTFSHGEIVSVDSQSAPRLKALHQFNELCARDPRVRSTILPTSDGLTFAVRI